MQRNIPGIESLGPILGGKPKDTMETRDGVGDQTGNVAGWRFLSPIVRLWLQASNP